MESERLSQKKQLMLQWIEKSPITRLKVFHQLLIIIIIMMSESQEASENDMCGGAIFSVPFI